MKRLYVHVGLPKTGTTFLQDIVFPESTFCYLGKSREVLKNDISNPFVLFKYLQNAQPGLPFSDLQIPCQLVDYLNHYREIISEEESLLISDELITGNPLLSCMGPLLANCTQLIANINDPEKCFHHGISHAEYLLYSSDQNALNARKALCGQNTATQKIQRLLDALGVELGGILLVKRDFGSWFTSFFLQYIKTNSKYPDFFKGDFTLPLVFAAAGFAFRWDCYMRDFNDSGFALASSFSGSIRREFGECILTTAEYSSSPLSFSENLKPALESYGINSQVCDRVNQVNLDKNVTKPHASNDRLEHQVYYSRDQISRDLNALVGASGGFKILN